MVNRLSSLRSSDTDEKMSGQTSFLSLLPVAAGVGGTFWCHYVSALFCVSYLPDVKEKVTSLEKKHKCRF